MQTVPMSTLNLISQIGPYRVINTEEWGSAWLPRAVPPQPIWLKLCTWGNPEYEQGILLLEWRSIISHNWIHRLLIKKWIVLSLWPFEVGMTVLNRWICALHNSTKLDDLSQDVVKYNLSPKKGKWQLKSSVDLRNRVLTSHIFLFIFPNNTDLTQPLGIDGLKRLSHDIQ